MAKKLFGTDGVRGRANSWPMTAAMALRLGEAAGRYFRRDGTDAHRVVIAKDTRLSGYMLENALTAGLTSTGMNVLLLGPVPTPGVGFLTRSMRADLGVMISASHNPHHDNGIKFFGPDGFKLSDEAEREIEAMIEGEIQPAQAHNIGRAKRIEDGRGRYQEFVKTSFPPGLRLDGLKVVVDCANGAAYRAAPEVLWELGATVIPLGVTPNGTNINDNCGSTHTGTAAAAVVAHGADLGIALDGDADRVMILDEFGQVADGDQIMALLASRWAADGRLRGGALVATVMSNLGLERFLTSQGIGLERTAVGDRYVVERMRAGGFNLGGEQSGHIVMTDYATTGDGLAAALQFLAEMVRSGSKASELVRQFETVPQLLKNVRYTDGALPLDDAKVKAVIAANEARIAGKGRILIRKSGTEPLIRVMAECVDEALLNDVVDEIAASVAAAGAAGAVADQPG
ncbi:phosphoglucosamine mutase [Xinfangfangia sp. D13-10-4-6]|uniref:phosphoglucosamine mutase n=1 Tax=Pseudogemmobacter hezensis TaxID=2737662 RepID=UPI001555DD7E|nr:phosphoglucosamine mutase [Pseudogemmobacter hezensis]NPD16223.1 phosphoglucosamine mutase [Pseudogemmobacter hezensis]